MFGTILCLVILGITFTLFGKMSLNDPDFQDIADLSETVCQHCVTITFDISVYGQEGKTPV